jgi:hypothetical protein
VVLTSSAGLSRWISTQSQLGSRGTELRFTVRGPASAEVSPCCHRPFGGDVACGVHVSIARPRAAGDALENRLTLAVFRRDMPTLVGTQPGNGQLRSCAPVRSASRPRQTLLQSAQSLRFAGTKARNAQHLACGKRNRHRNAAINTDDAAISRSRERFRDSSKSDVPTPRPNPSDSVRLHATT